MDLAEGPGEESWHGFDFPLDSLAQLFPYYSFFLRFSVFYGLKYFFSLHIKLYD